MEPHLPTKPREGQVNNGRISNSTSSNGVTYHTSIGGLITQFTLSQFFLNAGPSASTFLIPVEVFPTRVRATIHGIVAASGKSGAVLTSFAFGITTNAIGLRE